VHVGISLLTLSPGEQGGAETYARHLLRGLRSVGTLDYSVFVPGRLVSAAEGIQAVAVRELPFAHHGPPRIPAMSIAGHASGELRRQLRETDVVHYPLTVAVPRTRRARVLTLHDLQHHDFPELFSRSRRAFRHFAYDRAARGAQIVIVPSEFVREQTLERLELDPSRVHVIPHGVEHDLFTPSDEPREHFLLYPARLWKHKNHPRLLQAFVDLRRETPGLRLVLTGDGLDVLRNPPDGVELLGSVSHEELAALYRRAACLVFPSLYEGFGLPVLEAMASGCPVAASDRGAIPEVCGDAAVLFDPDDVYAIANGVREALARADELRERGIAHAASFTWEETARRHETAYEQAATEARADSSTTS
jgi:glycosyltransferase involved in cell wall biosynthesis